MSIEVPKLLQTGFAKKLNDNLLKNNRSFAFLGIPTCLIKLSKPTYYDAFFQYSILLSKLYHDYGMSFLDSFACEAKRNLNLAYRDHIDAMYAFRAVLVHSDDGKKAFRRLKNCYFKDDEKFTYKNWEDFWLNATDDQWKTLTEAIVRESNLMYDNLLYKISVKDQNLDDFSKRITNIFKTGSYKNEKSQDVLLYDKSFDYRFLQRICGSLSNTTNIFRPYGYWDAYARPFLEQKDDISKNMKTKIIANIKDKLVKDGFWNSDQLFNFIKQCVEEEISNQINQDNIDNVKFLFE